MFSKILTRLINDNRISQSELANELGTHRQNVYQWVSGKTVPRNDMLSKIADYFEVSIDYLLGKDNEQLTAKTKTNPPNKFTKQSVKQKLNSKFKSHKNLKEIFSDNLKYYRKQAGLTQDDFAKSVQTDPVYISYIENGKRFPSIEYIEKMAKVLKIDSYKLFLPANLEINNIANDVLYNKIKENVNKAIDQVFEYQI
ncbi:MAG: helix-turn-helix domain-containing protein [Candidatus Riflebacteria bacterium]|nr:helix-turn-helix domain-containing protein [Candidatus Riflebacteria bacterium]